MSYIFGKFGMSNLGNSAGTSGTVNRQIVFVGGNNVTLSQSINGSSATLSINAGGGGSINFSAGTTSNNLAAVTFSNSNGMGFGLNGSVITASHNAITSQSNQVLSMYAAGNVTQNTSAAIDARSLTFNGLGGVSVGYSNGSVQISGGAGGGGGGGIAIANAQTTYTNGTAHLSAAGAMTISTAGVQSFQLSVPQTSSLSAVAPISISTNGSTISIGMQDKTISSYVNILPASTGSQTLGALGISTGSAQFYPVSIDSNLQFNALRVAMQMSFATSTVSGRQTVSHTFGLFSNNANTLSLISSNSLSYAITNSSVSATLSVATATATTGYGYGSVSASATAQIHSLFGTVGLKAVELQFGNTVSLAPGMYWLGMLRRESSSSANIGLSAALAGNVMGALNSLAPIGLASSAQTTNFALRGPYVGFGPYTSTGSAGYGGTALPTSVFMSGIAHTGSIMPFMTFIST